MPTPQKLTPKAMYLLNASKSCYPTAVLEQIKADFEAAGLTLIVALYNLNAKEKPSFTRID